MPRILGVDPGSRITGYGLVDVEGREERFVDCGSIFTKGDHLPVRLKTIFEELSALIEAFRPDQMAIEQVFMHRNASSALKLGQARGAAICAGVMGQLPISEYTPTQVKQSVVGKGSADKAQVQHMVKMLLSLPEVPAEDAADALAIALCHAHTSATANQLGAQAGVSLRGFRKGRFR